MYKNEIKIILFLFSLVAIFLVVNFGIRFLGSGGDNHPLIGQKAPELKVKNLDDAEVSLASFAGRKAIILDFWASWCGPCRNALPVMEKLAKQYKPEQLSVIAVNVWDGDKTSIKNFLKEKDIKTVNIVIESDKEISDKYKFGGVPAIFILDSNLNIQKFYSGYSPSLERHIKKAVDKLIEGT